VLFRSVYGLADQVSRRVTEALLCEQAKHLSKEKMLCPGCQRELVPKPREPKRLLLRRGEVQWEQPVWRCPSCRRDFFPSGGSDGLCRGSGV